MALRILKDQNVFNKNVLVRVDLNVPIQNGQVTDTSRLTAIKETISFLLKHQAKIFLLSHFGRPKPSLNPQEWDLSCSLGQLTKPLEKTLENPVHFIPYYKGAEVIQESKRHSDKQVFLLENIRFDLGEEINSNLLAEQLAEGMDLYVNEAFSCSHRAHASIEAITHKLPSFAGFHFENEVTYYLEKCVSHPQHPLVAIVGGSKVSTKLAMLENLCQKVDVLIIGGAMANTFLAAQGKEIGSSLYEPNLLSVAKKILETSKAKIILPVDVIVANNLEDANATVINIADIQPHQKIFDTGPSTLALIKEELQKAQTIVWNGPVGAFEYQAFATGTVEIARLLVSLTQQSILTVAGGGDTLAALNMAQAKDQLTYVSTAGGAFLEWLEGKKLPGIEALKTP